VSFTSSLGVVRDPDALCLMTVHAHPDDESSKGAGSVAKAHAEGVRSVLVCCTGGEAGDILNPAMDTEEVRARLAHVRAEELLEATRIIGYDDVVLLGYRDSGMPDTEANLDPRSFAQAPLEQAVERLVHAIRAHRPHVVLTYADDQEGYPHPDHLRVHEISVEAFEAAGDPERYPGAGEPWQPLKLYYTLWARARIEAMHERFVALGLESPFGQRWFDRPSHDHRITTRVDISDFTHVSPEALRAHRTQVDPTSAFWFGLPTEEARTVYPWEDYELARSLVDTELPEDDLFAGVRDRVS
jgi:mycothiol S-conjugate amidase